MGNCDERLRSKILSTRIEFRETDAREMTFDDAVFDVIFASLSLHHLKAGADRTCVLSEIKRLLNPGGVILV